MQTQSGNWKLTLKAKHPVKFHVWISKRGESDICIFDGLMQTPNQKWSYNKALVPFMRKVLTLNLGNM